MSFQSENDPQMLPISLNQYSVARGELIALRVQAAPYAEYGQIQIEIVTAGVANPVNKLGFGNNPERFGSDEIGTNIDTKHLEPGLYEVALIRLHSPSEPNVASQIDFLAGRDFARQVFEVRNLNSSSRNSAELLAAVRGLETEIEQRFRRPVPIDDTRNDTYTVLVFLRDVLVGVGMRFDHFELIPTNAGLGDEEALRVVNDFLSVIRLGIQFEADEANRQQSRASNPVCVVHFPTLVARNMEAARDYAVEQANTLILALALSRDAGGVVFDVVALSQTSGSAVKYSIASPYVGNLLTGSLAGENFESISRYGDGLRISPTHRFLVELYREARRERSADFQYVRFWQILETMAEGENYDTSDALLDFSGEPMIRDERALLVKGSVNIVFNLLREEGIGETEQTWANVNTWFAFRNAVAHHGAVHRYTELSHKAVREWARRGYEQLQGTAGADSFLRSLRDHVKLLLMRRLVATSTGVRKAPRVVI